MNVCRVSCIYDHALFRRHKLSVLQKVLFRTKLQNVMDKRSLMISLYRDYASVISTD